MTAKVRLIFETTIVFGAFLAEMFGRMDYFCYICTHKFYYPTKCNIKAYK